LIDGTIKSSIVLTSPSPAIAGSILLVGGVTHARVRVSVFTSGAAIIDAKAVIADPITPYTQNGTRSISALNEFVLVPTNGMGNVAMFVTGTWVATLAFQGSTDNGTTFSSIIANLTAQAVTTTITANDRALVNCSGYTHVRLIATAYTSGTAVVNWGTGVAQQVTQVWNTNSASLQARVSGVLASGTADSVNPIKVGGRYNSALPVLASGNVGDLQLDTNARLIVASTPWDGKQTYSSVNAAFAPAASATDVFTITGSATKIVRILRIYFSGVQTTGGNIPIGIIKRSTANTGGTSAAVTAVPLDSNNAAATATVLSYTANPTLGTLVGTVRAARVFIPATTGSPILQVFEFQNDGTQALILRGTSQVAAISLNGNTIAGGSVCIGIDWVEE
jgi:hypothetical protein